MSEQLIKRQTNKVDKTKASSQTVLEYKKSCVEDMFSLREGSNLEMSKLSRIISSILEE